MIKLKKITLEISGIETTVGIDEAQDIVDALTKMFSLERHKPVVNNHPFFSQPTINPGMIGGGINTASNTGLLNQGQIGMSNTLTSDTLDKIRKDFIADAQR